MPKKYVVFFKSIGRQWILILIIAIVIVAFYDAGIAILLTLFMIIVYVISFIPPLINKYRLSKFLQQHERLEDKVIARKFNRPLYKIQKRMFTLSEKQYKKDWLVVFLNKHYIFYRQDVVKRFNLLLQKGSSEKELLEKMQGAKVLTRAEVKAMKDTLVKLDRAYEPEKLEKKK